MPVSVTASFVNVNEYEIRVETVMNYAQWKRLIESIDPAWNEPMRSFLKPIREALDTLDAKIQSKSKPDLLS